MELDVYPELTPNEIKWDIDGTGARAKVNPR